MSNDLNKLIEQRRSVILNWLYQQTNGTVLYGPFQGMKIAPNFCWGDGDTGGKLLGIYENELFGALEEVVASKPDVIVNYGCAEGYYGVGLAMMLPETKVVFVDIEEKALTVSKENAQLNSIENAEYIKGGDQTLLESLLSSAKNPFLLMDCEGAEDYLLDLDTVPSLARTTILVEVHEFMSQGMTDRLVYKFNETHDLEGIVQGSKNYHVEPLTLLGDLDKAIINNENRPNTMNWIFMRVKK